MDYCYKICCKDLDMLTGKCKLSACNKIKSQTYVIPESYVIPEFYKRDEMVFPHTIGKITFYSSKELIKWVEDQQKMNEDPDYGRGNWA
jgi:hypothetical protein